MISIKMPSFVGVLTILQLLLSNAWASTAIRKPFRVIWNYPDQVCQRHNISYNLASYGIEFNENDFIEDTIALYYAERFGAWPYIGKNGEWNHGGLPQEVDVGLHLDNLNMGITDYGHHGDVGYGVIDMELWRPVFRTNYGRMLKYVNLTIDYVREVNPDYPEDVVHSVASQTWEVAAQYLMTSSIAVAKASRPNEKWGYYRYPELTTRRQNDQLAWLWRSVTAYYPSIYIKTFQKTFTQTRDKIIEQIAETFRVRALHGFPEDPIMVYTIVQSNELGFFEGKWLELAIQLPIDLGVDGLILWASSNQFTNPAEAKCQRQAKYVKETLGPKIKSLMDKMKRCSFQLCGGNGRCIRNNYLDKVPFVLDRGIITPPGIEPRDEVPNKRRVEKEFKTYYSCQCYSGWYGSFCRRAEDLYDNGENRRREN